MQNVKVEAVSQEQINQITADLNLIQVFKEARPVAGCRKVHSFTHVNGKLHTAELSKDLITAPPPPLLSILPILLEHAVH